MKTVTFEILNSTFSKARIASYLKGSDNPDQILAEYHANIRLSEAMIPALHYLEICLRNRIDQALKKYYTQNWLVNPAYNSIISEQDIKKINIIQTKVLQVNKRNATHDDIIAQMTFGFWCSFFHRRYDPIIWHRKDTFKIIFPNLSRIHRKRSYIEKKILKIKEIRNRIAHHEPILNRKVSLIKAHSMCYELIEAMSEDALSMIKIIDRFSEVYQNIIITLKN